MRENSNAPSVGMRPTVGLKPTTPQNAAGRITEPLVCEPIAAGTTPAATAAADPIDEPPGVREGSQGFSAWPGVMNASSAVTVFPSTIAPAASAALTAGHVTSGTRPANSALPFSVGIPAVSKMSLTPIGMPSSGPTVPPERRRSSEAVASRCARAASSQTKAWICGSVSA